ncbi:switch-associated protein 70 [Aplysia californica]|uniref:Switch-associated protein 70 n=1 Tax=Aplysia californica TaxID=6500 RepID=A0ABM0K4D9_APLCA|nr:switch-associated protein 70 [Aplysia californica]
MAMEEVKKSLWHAFDILDKSAQPQKVRTTQVHKTKLRVLTNNLGHILQVDSAETIWDKVTEDNVTFDDFMDVLSNNLLVGLAKLPEAKNATLKSEIDNLCWMLCERTYVQRIKSLNESEAEAERKERREFSSTDRFRLWKIFNFLCEQAEDGSVLTPLRIDVEETERIAVEICKAVGIPVLKPNALERRLSYSEGSFLLDFSEFVSLVAERIGDEEAVNVVGHGISEVSNQIISDVVRKGHLVKFGNKVTTWKERWFVLTATALRYYVSAEEKDLKGTIFIGSGCFTQSFPDRPGGKHHRFKLHTPNKQYELSAPDLRSKNEWMSDIKHVVNSVGSTGVSLQRLAWKERKKEREEKRRRTAEEEMRRVADREKLLDRERQLEEERKQRQLAQEEIKERERLLELERQKRAEEEEQRRLETSQLLEEKRKEIEDEKQRFADIEQRLKEEREALVASSQEALEAEREQRAQVEARLREEEAQLEEERRRLRELEEAKVSLEALVEEERALKRDEEIVRNLQSRILEEELLKREELEKLQAEQQRRLEEEQLSRQGLEAVREQQEEELRLAQETLEKIAWEREEADRQMREAADKLKQAERERQVLEERLRLKEMTTSVRLARPLDRPDPNPFVTHRGLGAFTEAEFQRRLPDSAAEGADSFDVNELSVAAKSLTL